MRRIFLSLMFAGFMAGALLSCSTMVKTSKASPEWYSNMHRLSHAHLRLIPQAASAKQFSDPANRKALSHDLKEMAEAAGGIVHDEKALADPLIEFSRTRFAIEIRQAYQAFQMNDHQWSRFALSRATGYCISCHTRSDRGDKDFDLSWTPQLSSLNPSQKVDFLLANRRYASAVLEAKRMASDSSIVQKDPRSWFVSIEKVLALLVRVKHDTAEAESIAKLVVNNKAAPFYMRSDATRWLRDINQWKKEVAQRKRHGLSDAVRLMRISDRSGTGRSRAGLVSNLRASATLHKALENTKSPQYGEALLYAGIVSQSLGSLNMGFLDQYYFESCIRFKPHSDLSEQCYDHFERSVRETNPFLDLEPDGEWTVAARLGELRKLSEIKNVLEEPVWRRRPWEDDVIKGD